MHMGPESMSLKLGHWACMTAHGRLVICLLASFSFSFSF